MPRTGPIIVLCLALAATPTAGCFLGDDGETGILDRDIVAADTWAPSDTAAADPGVTDASAPADAQGGGDPGATDPGVAADVGTPEDALGGPDAPADAAAGDDGTPNARCTQDGQCDKGNECTDSRCVEGRCQHQPIQGGCDDGNPCTLDDRCVSGKCVGGGALTCDDEDACTDDACKPGVGCVFAARDCDDGNPCTADACIQVQGCVHKPQAGPCEDGDLCTTNDRCDAGGCAGGPPLDCGDWDPCTSDWCEKGVGCLHALKPECPGPCVDAGDCDDGDPCTVDVCNPFQGSCEHTRNPTCLLACLADQTVPSDPTDLTALLDLLCLDGDECTVDLCLPGLGCHHLPVDDCDAECDPFLPACDDGDPCTLDACDPFTGRCYRLPSPDCARPCRQASDCLDGNPCTLDLCAYAMENDQGATCLNLPFAGCVP